MKEEVNKVMTEFLKDFIGDRSWRHQISRRDHRGKRTKTSCETTEKPHGWEVVKCRESGIMF